MPRRKSHDVSVHRSISMPMSIMEKILDEADLMGKGFSETVVVLVVLGLQAKKTTKINLESELKGGGSGGH